MHIWGKRWLQAKLRASRCMFALRSFFSGRKFRGWLSDATARARMSPGGMGKPLSITAAGLLGAVMIFFFISAAHQNYIETHTNEVFQVYVGDDLAGVVSDPEIVRNYLISRQEQVNADHPDVHMVLQTEPITYESITGFKLHVDDGAVLEQIGSRIVTKASGVDLWVDDKFIGVVKDQETANALLARYRAQYVPDEREEVSILAANAQPRTEGERIGSLQSVEFVEEVSLNDVVINPDEIMDPEQVIATLENRNMKRTTYTVQQGDCVSCIAEKFNISRQIIYENNPWIADDFINVGDELDLTVHEPTLSVRSVEEVRELEKIHYPTQYVQDDTMRQGRTEVVQNGEEGQKQVVYQLTKVNGILVAEELVDEIIIEEPVPQIVKRGTKIIPGEGTGSFSWPVSNPRVTSSYGMRWGSLHKGIDMVGSNNNILAADNGVVEFAGYNRGYGNYVKIDHNNGYHTLYAHLSEINVSKGERVQKGDVIGIMGTTGHSTGVHLHFEIHKNGSVQNPSNYLTR